MKKRPSSFLTIFKVLFLCVCLGMSLLQSYYELDNYLEKKILTSSDIVDVKSAPIHLVFCDTYPLENRVCYDKDNFLFAKVQVYNAFSIDSSIE